MKIGNDSGSAISIRLPTAAGRFYPADPDHLRATVEQFMKESGPLEGNAPKALIVPHAGYMFSGSIAASGYAQLKRDASRISRVVLIGPAHYVPFTGIAASTAHAFLTPLGEIPVDTAGVQSLVESGCAIKLDDAHTPEHSLEVHLPFLQVLLSRFTLIPLLVGEATPEQVSAALQHVWGGDETRILVSSDLSHFLPYDAAEQIDAVTSESILALSPEQIGENQACGRLPVCGFLRAAKAHCLQARTISLGNSGDFGGPRERVVGYGAFGFYDSRS